MQTIDFFEDQVQATKRTSMLHLQKMSDVEFIQFVQHVAQTMQGQLKNLKVSLKVDGAGARFGKDATGRTFFEGSRTGPIFEPKAFSTHAASKGAADDIMLRARHYDDIWEIVTQSNFVKSLPADTKVVCELFYNPMGEITDDGIKFVSVSYDQEKLGRLMTIVPFKAIVASTGEDHPQSSRIVQNLYAMSNTDVKFIDPNLATKGAIDIGGLIDPILSMGPETVATLQSRKRDDMSAKSDIREIIQTVKDDVADFILTHPAILDKFKLGPEIEGLVLNINGREVKVTTPEFKAAKSAEAKARATVKEHKYSFLNELVEARIFKYPENLEGRNALDLSRLLFASILALEILRNENESVAYRYASQTVAFNDFDHMRAGSTDLANMIAVLTNQDQYEEHLKTKIGLYAPELQIKTYLRTFFNVAGDLHQRVRTFLLKLDQDLMIAGSDMHMCRRVVSDWRHASSTEKTVVWSTLSRVFNRQGPQIDIYQLVKSNSSIY